MEKKEIQFLNFIFKKVKGEHKDYVYVKNYLSEIWGFPPKLAFEIAYLYDNNFQEDGDFTKVTDPIRMSYEKYMDLPEEILALMKELEDHDPENFEVLNSYRSQEEIKHDGTSYYVYSDWDMVDNEAFQTYDWLCDDPDEHLRSYLYMTATDQRLFADDESESYVDNMSDEEVVDIAGIEDKVEKLSVLEELKEKLDEIDDEDEYDQIKEEIENLEEELDNMRTYDELIESYRSVLKEAKYDEVYDQLNDDPVDYFIDNGYYSSITELIKHGPLTFDCDQVKRDYIDNEDENSIASALGYEWIGEVKINNNRYYIFSQQ